MSMIRELGHRMGRFKMRSLMKEAGLVSKQPGAYRYQVARSERPDIPNLLAHVFAVQQPNQVWFGDTQQGGTILGTLGRPKTQ